MKNCDCIADLQKRLAKHAAEEMGATNPKVKAQFTAIDLSGDGGLLVSLPFTLRADNRPYNTVKGKPMNMIASFCPFCGKPAKGKSGTGNASNASGAA